MVTGRTEFDKAAEAITNLASGFTPRKAIVEIILVGERKMAWLNYNYKGRRGAAEILTFCYSDEEDSFSPGGPTGEIYLCWNKLVAGAAKRRVSRRSWLLRLVVHGLCHVQGFVHGSEVEGRKMEKAERRNLEGVVPIRTLDRMFE
jgi:rRNA maturation RNase YbeY